MGKIQTKTSSSNGKIQFKHTSSTSGDYIYSCRDDPNSSRIFSEMEITIDELDDFSVWTNRLFDYDLNLTGKGLTVNIDAQIFKDGDLDDYAVNFKNTSLGINQTILTDEEGIASFYYECNGGGNTDITVICGDWEETVSFTDVYQYLNAKGSLNKEYKIIHGVFRELSSYFQFQTSTSNKVSLIRLSKDSVALSDDWTVYFDVISSTTPITFFYGYALPDTDEYVVTDVSVALKGADRINIDKQNGTMTLLVNEIVRSSFGILDNDIGAPVFGIQKNGSAYLSFDKLIFKKVQIYAD